MTDNNDHDYKPEMEYDDACAMWRVGWLDEECCLAERYYVKRDSAEHFAATLRGDKAKALAAEVERLTAELEGLSNANDDWLRFDPASAERLLVAIAGLVGVDPTMVDGDGSYESVVLDLAEHPERWGHLTAVGTVANGRRYIAERDNALERLAAAQARGDGLAEQVERLTAERDSQKALADYWFSLVRYRKDPDAPPILCERVDDTDRDGEMVPTWRDQGRRVVIGRWLPALVVASLTVVGVFIIWTGREEGVSVNSRDCLSAAVRIERPSMVPAYLACSLPQAGDR